MKQFIIILGVFMVTAFNAAGQDEAFKNANDLYAQGDFEKAIAEYENIAATGMVSGALFYNLGNAYYKSGELASAVLNFERAKLYMPKDKDLNYNLEMAQRMVVDKIEMVDVFFLKRWVFSVGNNLSSDEWTKTGLAAFVLFVVFLAFYTFGKSTAIKRMGFYLGIIMILFTTVSFIYAGSLKNKITERNGAIVFNPTVTVKGSPDESGTELFILHEGTKVSVRDSIGEWNEIILGDGNIGWLKKSSIKKI